MDFKYLNYITYILYVIYKMNARHWIDMNSHLYASIMDIICWEKGHVEKVIIITRLLKKKTLTLSSMTSLVKYLGNFEFSIDGNVHPMCILVQGEWKILNRDGSFLVKACPCICHYCESLQCEKCECLYVRRYIKCDACKENHIHENTLTCVNWTSVLRPRVGLDGGPIILSNSVTRM
jgi:hypothetical protein